MASHKCEYALEQELLYSSIGSRILTLTYSHTLVCMYLCTCLHYPGIYTSSIFYQLLSDFNVVGEIM